MARVVVFLLVTVMGGSIAAADSQPRIPARGPLAASVAREAARLARSTSAAPSMTQVTQPRRNAGGWIARHPKVFGALVGFGVGCAIGASGVGGSTDNFFNALDEFACPVVGGIGAGAGAVVAAAVK